ncbi:MAG TPA: FHA domain-containing protein [Pyrinomonadaceae bacterium]|nr:FHA domain-containing protein [Pyrinomonadaceae bacterium]
MSLHLTVTLPASLGNKTVGIDARRFSIGRTPENDLQIEDASLSRRHALIENVEGRFMLSDCGSSNGTFVNGTQVAAATQLADWDVLTFGGVGDVVVRIQEDTAQSAWTPIENSSAMHLPPQAVTARPRGTQPTGAPIESFVSKPIVAIAAVVVILIVTGAVLLISQRSKSGGSSNLTAKKQDTVTAGDDNAASNNSDLSRSPNDQTNSDRDPNNADGDSSELSLIESCASRVLTGISRDRRSVLTEKPLKDIDATVQRYKGSSSLAEQLRVMKKALPQVSTVAKSNGVAAPLVVYATLAQIDRDGRGDPAQVAAGLAPTLARMRAIFGDELASDSLLSVAALEEGPSLQLRITKLAGRVSDSPATIRSVWYLHDHQTISDQTFNFVLRFLALGVIAQDPQKFGVSAEPLIF